MLNQKTRKKIEEANVKMLNIVKTLQKLLLDH